MAILKSILNRLNNKGTILAITGLVLSLCIQLGFEVQSDKITEVVNIICTILVSLGILNNPVDTKEMYIPGVSDKLVEKQPKAEDVKAEAKAELEKIVNEVAEVKAEADAIVNEGK